MSHDTIETIRDVSATAGTIALNWITWSGTVQLFDVVQKVLTAVVSAAMIMYYVYGVMEKRRNLRANDKDASNDTAR